MKKLSILLMTTLVLFLAGCATTFPKKATQEDCLVLLKTEVVDKAHGPTTRNYFLNFSGGYPQQILFTPYHYVAIVVHEPDVTIDAISTNVGAGTLGSYGKFPWGYKLPYEAGKVLILNFVYVNTITQVEARTFNSQLSRRPLTDDERTELTAELDKRPEYKTWLQ